MCARQPALVVGDRLLRRDPTKAQAYLRRAHVRARYCDFDGATADMIAGLALAARKPRR
jgi:hypothetical protein